MRGRPDVDVKVPTVAHPGDEVPIVVTLESHSETPIDFVELTWAGTETVSLASDGEQMANERPIVHRVIRLREKGTLDEGKHRFEARVKVPVDAPGSYVGIRVTIRYEVRIHVAIPWWPDLREAFDLLVEPRPTSRPKPAPATKSSPQQADPFVELSLSDTAFAAGDEIAGAFAVGNAPSRDGLGVEISLVSIETARGPIRARAEQFRHMVPTVFRAPRTGVEVPFRFRVPKQVVPSFQSPWCDLRWLVQATLRPAWGSAVSSSVDVTVGRYATAADPTSERPRIGAQKWRKLWSEIGQRHELTLAKDRLALEGTSGDVQIDVARDESDDEPAMVATLRYPSLGIAIRIAKRGFLVRPTDLDDRLPGYKVECREHDQGAALLGKRACSALLAFDEIRVDDTHLTAKSAGGGLDAAVLQAFLEKTITLAGAWRKAIQQIPIPAAMVEALHSWTEFALTTGAHFCLGGMALTAASTEGAVFDIATLFDAEGQITGTRVVLDLDPALPYEVSIHKPETFSAAPPGSREQALALQSTVQSLALSSYSIQITVPGPVMNPEDLRPKLVEMVSLARRMRGERSFGPYR